MSKISKRLVSGVFGLYLTSVSISISISISDPAAACTAFTLSAGGQVVAAKGYDWLMWHGYGDAFVNVRGIRREGMAFDGSTNAARWRAKYGSITFTQFGRGFPIGGMNENGLVVEMLQLNGTVYNSQQGDLPFVNEAQWTQQALDMFSSTAEVLANLDKIRVVQAYVGIHYYVTDAGGNTATIDYIDGRPVVHTGSSLPYPILTNGTYDKSLQSMSQGAPITSPVPSWERTSDVRFQTAARWLGTLNSGSPEEMLSVAFGGLRNVSLEGVASDTLMAVTQWNLVYDITERRIFFRTRNSPRIKEVRMADFDFRRGATEMMLDINVQAAGPVRNLFENYADSMNVELIEKNRWLVADYKRKAAIEHSRQEHD